MSGNSQGHAQYDTENEVMWFIGVQKEPSWEQCHFLHEYQIVHANLARIGHKHSGLPLHYVQFGAADLRHLDGADENTNPDDDPWDFVTSLCWPSTNAIWETLQNPSYRKTAGKHIFCRQDQKGVLTQKSGVLGSETERSVEEGNFAIHVFYRRVTTDDEASIAWVETRVKMVGGWTTSSGGTVRQYGIWTDTTPEDTDTFFEGTQFIGGSWHQFFAVERFVFSDRNEGETFWREERKLLTGYHCSTYAVGGLASIVI